MASHHQAVATSSSPSSDHVFISSVLSSHDDPTILVSAKESQQHQHPCIYLLHPQQLRRQVIAIPVQLRAMSIAAASSNSEQPLIQTVQQQLSLHLLCTVSSSGRSFSSAINWSRYNSQSLPLHHNNNRGLQFGNFSKPCTTTTTTNTPAQVMKRIMLNMVVDGQWHYNSCQLEVHALGF